MAFKLGHQTGTNWDNKFALELKLKYQLFLGPGLKTGTTSSALLRLQLATSLSIGSISLEKLDEYTRQELDSSSAPGTSMK